MKIYFYGATEKAAKKKCDKFITQLRRFDTEERMINVTSIYANIFEVPDGFPIPTAYRVQVFCEYSIMAKQK